MLNKKKVLFAFTFFLVIFGILFSTSTKALEPIVISGLTHTFNVAPNPTPNVTVTFNTNVAAGSSFVLTLPNGDKICPTGASLTCVSYIDAFKNTTLKTSHSFVAGSLIPGNYSFTVYAAYPGNNASVVSQNGTFSVSTATPALGCGSAVGAACCVTGSKCLLTSPYFLYCFSNACQSVSAKAASIDEWSAAFNSLSLALDFNNDNITSGDDYALWLRAGHTL